MSSDCSTSYRTKYDLIGQGLADISDTSQMMPLMRCTKETRLHNSTLVLNYRRQYLRKMLLFDSTFCECLALNPLP